MELCLSQGWFFFVPYASPITFSLSSFPTSCYNQIHEKPNYTNEKPNHTLMLTMNKTTSYLHTKILCSPNQQPNHFSFQLHKTWIEIDSIQDYSTYPFLIYNIFNGDNLDYKLTQYKLTQSSPFTLWSGGVEFIGVLFISIFLNGGYCSLELRWTWSI